MNIVRFRLSTLVAAFIFGAVTASCQWVPSGSGNSCKPLDEQRLTFPWKYFGKASPGSKANIGTPGLSFNQFKNLSLASQDKAQSNPEPLFRMEPLNIQLPPLSSLLVKKGYICHPPVIVQSPNPIEPIPTQWASLKIEPIPTEWPSLHLAPVTVEPSTLAVMPIPSK